ncbi:hypothetical protein AB9F29_20620 [Falsihalocynthiibacter sp. S25ZX9]|uniref:hypothetical protein n=1 Tax=Falsihalocynthiibacter sp. S25ZX9 TaxID=3240870 RepID=UPI00350FEE2B
MALQNIGSPGSLPTFAAFAHEINVKSEGERRLCGTKCEFAATAPMVALLEDGGMKRSVKSVFILVTVCFAVAGNLSAQSLGNSVEACLPPTSDGDANAEDCSLTYRPPTPIGPNIDVSDCRFLPGRSEVLGRVILTMQCTIFNRSEERVVFFKYGVRYMESGSSTVLVEAGFEGEQRFGTANLVPILQPQETRSLRLAAPDLPTDAIATELDVSVEVLRVGMPDGRFLR